MSQHDHSEHGEHTAHHPRPPSGPELRARALEALLVAKGLVTTDAVDAVISYYEHDVGPQNGAKVVARAWVDPAYRERLLADGTGAIAELGYGGAEGDNMVVVANTPNVHNAVVCTLCSCYPWPVLGLPPTWYKSPPYRARPPRWGSACGTPAPRSAIWCCRCARRAPTAGARSGWRASSPATA